MDDHRPRRLLDRGEDGRLVERADGPDVDHLDRDPVGGDGLGRLQAVMDHQAPGEDAQVAFDKRMQEVLGPISDDISKALDAYAKSRGITLILDVTKFQGIVSASDSLDITRAFITEFNSKNPATASLNPK